jgi:hypothetical protein
MYRQRRIRVPHRYIERHQHESDYFWRVHGGRNADEKFFGAPGDPDNGHPGQEWVGHKLELRYCQRRRYILL